MAVAFPEEESVIGRSFSDLEEYGKEGAGYLGRVVISKGERPVLGRKILIDLAKPHVILICGKRGYGKSYTMAVLLEEFARLPVALQNRIAVIVIDTVGIFWSLKMPNKFETSLLEEWGLQAQSTNARVLVPKGLASFYREKGIPIDGTFTIKASELTGIEWMALFKLSWRDPEGVLITRIIEELKEKIGTYFGIDEIIAAIQADKESDSVTKQALINRLKAAKSWGLIEKTGTRIRDIARPATITIIDVSAYRQAIEMEGVRDIIVALLGKKLFEERMLYRKEEEAKLITQNTRTSEMPLVWLFVDEAHMFMPKSGKNIALNVLLEWARVGRQPGLSLVLATQRPEKLHPDFLSQCDIFISHRLTAGPDIQAVSMLRPSYLYQDLAKYYEEMPRGKGFAIVLDDNSEKLWLIKVRPRFSWDAGVTASAFTI
jgi:hypothetical protein